MSNRHVIWFVAYEGVQALDLTGPHEVFAAANDVADSLKTDGLRYDLRVITPSDTETLIETDSGLRLVAEPWPVEGECPHTLLIPGGDGARVRTDDLVTEHVRRVGAKVGRLACVCTGAYVAAQAGLLEGRRVATHWAHTRALANEHPSLDVDGDAIYTVDGHIWTSAGVTAGIDLALAIVEHDLGSKVAQEVGRWLVVFLHRAGGQSQFAPTVWSARSDDGPVRQAQDLIDRDPAAVESVAALAAAVGLSPRHFTRRFAEEVGQTPARYLENVRVAAARQHLERGDDGLAVVAERCGFGTSETLRRVFQRRLGVSPDTYRKHFTAV